MARNRMIHPGICTSEELSEVSIEARYLAAVLPCFCDREGRIEHKPKKIRAMVFPYEPKVRITQLINQLCNSGFLTAYAVGAVTVLQIPNFAKYQKIHPREAKSDLPPKPKDSPGVPKAHLDSPNNASVEVEVEVETETEVEVISKKTVSPPPDPLKVSRLREGCEWFRCSDHERELAIAHYRKEGLDPKLLPHAMRAVEAWLDKGTGKALKARKQETHYRRLYDTWAIEDAQRRMRCLGVDDANPRQSPRLRAIAAEEQFKSERRDRLRTLDQKTPKALPEVPNRD